MIFKQELPYYFRHLLQIPGVFPVITKTDKDISYSQLSPKKLDLGNFLKTQFRFGQRVVGKNSPPARIHGRNCLKK